jgi:hypothetical protein
VGLVLIGIENRLTRNPMKKRLSDSQ